VNIKLTDWLVFIALALIWGSSFILMKIGLDNQLSAYHIAAIRIVSAGIVLLPIAVKAIKKIPWQKRWLVFLSGTLGSLIPAFLFCIAEEAIDSALAGTLNTLTPIFVILTGALFFNTKTAPNKIIGITIAFSGCVLLLFSKGSMQNKQLSYTTLVVAATMLYGFNVNMVSRNLLHISSLHITAVALSFNAIPALVVLIFTGFLKLPLTNPEILKGTAAAICLGVMGTAVATVLFYMLVKRANSIFASMVTYAIPFVAIGWGFYYKEDITLKQIACLFIILIGVYLANKKQVMNSTNKKEDHLVGQSSFGKD
jgi:drug/metabolite transporter (DMT)-like permease